MDKNTTNDNDSQWTAVLEALSGSLTKGQYSTHFLGSRARFDGSTVVVSLPPSANLPMVENQLQVKVFDAVKRATGRAYAVRFEQVTKTRTRTVEQVMSTTDDSDGFDMPRENWSKLPHGLIAKLDKFSSLSELKVVLYILRHTWGYQDEWKKITMDEFVNGRRTNNPEAACHCPECEGRDKLRIDHGLGMTKKTVIDGIKRAIEHKFIVVEVDDSDRGRVRKHYAINYKK